MKKKWLHTILILGIAAFGTSQATPLPITLDDTYVLTALLTAAGTAEVSQYGTVSAASVSGFTHVTTGGASQPSSNTFPIVNPDVVEAAASSVESANAFTAYSKNFNEGASGSAASGTAFWDTLTFSGPGGASHLTLTVSGAFGNSGSANAAACLEVGVSSVALSCLSNSTVFNSATPTGHVIDTFTLPPGKVSMLSFGAIATEITGSGDVYADLDPSWFLVLPAGETYTSASGLFTFSSSTGGTPSVPEPPMLLLLGFGLLGIMAWQMKNGIRLRG